MATWKVTRPAAVMAFLAHGLFAVSMSAVGSDSRPVIEVKVAIEAPSLSTLPKRDFVEREVASKIAERFRDRHRLFTWVSSGAGSRVATLVARVTQTFARPLPTIDLEWVLVVPGQANFPLPVASQSIYTSGQIKRGTSEPNEFLSDLDQAVRGVLQAGFHDRFREQVVQRIPIARGATANASDQTISIPLRWSDAQLGPDALVRVSFERQEGDATKRGYLDLELLNERLNDPDKGMIQGGVQAAVWGSGALPLSSRWHAELPGLLSGASIRCHVTRYREGFGGSSLGSIQLTP